MLALASPAFQKPKGALKMSPSCANCGSSKLLTYDAEANIHFPGLRNVLHASVFAFPKLTICLDCGQITSKLSENELRMLRQGPIPVKNSRKDSAA
jgi:hypothetical protein